MVMGGAGKVVRSGKAEVEEQALEARSSRRRSSHIG